MQYIGKLDTKKLGKYSEKIITDEVILTEERRIHIYENHTADYEIIINNIEKTVLQPNEVIEDLKNKDTLFFIGKLGKNNLNVIIKLNTVNSIEHPQNSIMTAWIIRNSNLEKMRKRNKIIYKRE